MLSWALRCVLALGLPGCLATTGSRSGSKSWSAGPAGARGLAAARAAPQDRPREGIKTIVTLTAINSSDPSCRQARLTRGRDRLGDRADARLAGDGRADGRGRRSDGRSRPSAGLFPLRRGASSDQPGTRRVPDPPPGILGGTGLASGLEPPLGSPRLGGRPQRSLPDRGICQGRATRCPPPGAWSLGDRAWSLAGTDGPVDRPARSADSGFPLGWIGWNQATHNFGVLRPGRIYRSGQMPPAALRRTLRDYHIKTVLNLQGPEPAGGLVSRRDRRDAGARERRRSTSPSRRASGCRVSSSAPGPGSRLVRVPRAGPLRLGVGTDRTGLGHRRTAAARRHARRGAGPARAPLLVRPAGRRQDHGRVPRPVRGLAGGADGLAHGPKSSAAGRPRGTVPASRTARNGRTIRPPWWWSRSVPATADQTLAAKAAPGRSA